MITWKEVWEEFKKHDTQKLKVKYLDDKWEHPSLIKYIIVDDWYLGHPIKQEYRDLIDYQLNGPKLKLTQIEKENWFGTK